MGEHQRPKLVGPNGRRIDAHAGEIHENAEIMSVEEALRADILELQARHGEAVAAILIHHQTLQQLVALVNSLEDRTLRGRIRRFVAWFELQREVLRGYAIELGLMDPPPPSPAVPKS